MNINSSWNAPSINGHAYTKQEDESFYSYGNGFGYVNNDVIANGIVINGKQVVSPEEYQLDLPALDVTHARSVDNAFLKVINDNTKYVPIITSDELDKILLPSNNYAIVDEDTYNYGIPSKNISRKQFRTNLGKLGLKGFTIMPSDIYAANQDIPGSHFRPGFPEATNMS